MRHELYNMCKYSTDEPNYIKYNRIIWDTLEYFDDEALRDTIEQLKGLL